MPTLLEHIATARALLESNVIRQPALVVANSWRDCVRMGDHYLETIAAVATAASSAASAKDPMTSRRANSDVSGAMRRVQGVTGKFYEDFKTGRENLYEVAKLLGVTTYRPASKYGKHPTDLRLQSDDQILAAMDAAARGLQKGISEMLNLGARMAGSSGSFRLAARVPETPPPELGAALVSAGLDFRDSVSLNVFARTNSVIRRALELSRRNWELMMFEGSNDSWSPPWAHDPEIGNVEA